jgi:capsular polysaccharide transport system permease protein
LAGKLRRPSFGNGRVAAANTLSMGDAYPRFTLADHLFIVRALILRNLKLRYQETRLGFLSEFFVPIGIMAMHFYAFTLMGRFMPAGIPVELFVLGGFTTWFTLSHAARGSMLSRRSRIPQIVGGVTHLHSLIAAAAWECLAFTALCFVSLLLLMLFGHDEPMPDVPLSVAVYVVAATAGMGMRMILDALGELFSLISHLKVAIFWLTFLTSGIYFSACRIDGALAPFALYNPALHLLEFQRHALFPGYPIAMVSMVYPIACALVLLLSGLIIDRWVERWTSA